MKATCIECGEHNQWVSECPECNEMICDECYPMHERECRTFRIPENHDLIDGWIDRDPGF